MASRLAGKHGRWSRIWAKRVLEWRDDLERARNADHFVSRVYHWHGAQWLRQQRLQHGNVATSGRTRTPEMGRGHERCRISFVIFVNLC